MTYNVLILGASYGSLLATKLLMAGHNATLVCRDATAALINREGTEVRLKLKGEKAHRSLFSKDLPGTLDATTPETVDLSRFDLVVLAMQEPQYAHPTLLNLLIEIAKAGLPCLSLMNIPPLPYLKRMPGLDTSKLDTAYAASHAWKRFEPGLVTLCSPDPQAFRPPEEAANVLQVGLPTNFKAAPFENAEHTAILRTLEKDIDAVLLDGHDVPVKLKVFDSLFVPLAKWSMLMVGNYRCITAGAPVSICDAVHGDVPKSREIYQHVIALIEKMGGAAEDMVPFEKYAAAAKHLQKPSSAARSLAAGASQIERVDQVIALVAEACGMQHPAITEIVARVDAALKANNQAARVL